MNNKQFVAAMVLCGFISIDAVSEEIQANKRAESKSKTYTTETDSKPRLSRKCGIYSGVCPMNKKVEVGAYCICNTPSGPIHGVVIP